MKAADFFSAAQKEQIRIAIQEAEQNTSGEIRVHIENKIKLPVLDRASMVFNQLKMQQTQLRNGILFYLALENKQFAILGDVGINAKVQENFWDQIKDVMTDEFKQANFTDGLSKGIIMAGAQLKQHFPFQADDENELSDEISFGK